MRWVEPRVPQSAALQRCQPRLKEKVLSSPWRLFHRPLPATRMPLPHAEMVWLPYYLVDIAMQSTQGASVITVSVQGYSGAFAIFEMHERLSEGEPPGDHFPPKLQPAVAEKIGRRELLMNILRQRGRKAKPEPRETRGVSLIYYPFWVYYYVRRGNRIDIKVLDAVTGEKAGARTRIAVLQAFEQFAANQAEPIDEA